MSNVLIEKNKLDVLATAIANKSGEPLKLTLAEMVEAVDGIETGGGGITPTGNIDITEAGVTDVTNYATATVASANPYIYYGVQYITQNGNRLYQVRGAVGIDNEGADPGYIDYGNYFGQWYTYDAIPLNTTVTPTESAQTIGGANTMMEGAVTVNAIPSQYIVPSGTKSITENGVGIDVTEFASVDVSVSGGGGVTVTDEANSTGITCVITSGSSPTPPSPDIPLNTQLIDYTAVTNDYALNVSGGLDPAQWYAVSDYTEISSTMTFAYTGIYWGYLGFYDSSKNPISTIYMVNDATQRQDDPNFGDGTLTLAKIPLNAKYVRITTQTNPDSTQLSLIRTS